MEVMRALPFESATFGPPPQGESDERRDGIEEGGHHAAVQLE